MILQGLLAMGLFWVIAKGVLAMIHLVPGQMHRYRLSLAFTLLPALYVLFSIMMAHQARSYWIAEGRPWGWSFFLLGAVFAYGGTSRPLAGQWWRSSRTVHFLSYYSLSGTADDEAVASHRRYRLYLRILAAAVGLIYLFFTLFPDAIPQTLFEPVFAALRDFSLWKYSWAPLIALLALGVL